MDQLHAREGGGGDIELVWSSHVVLWRIDSGSSFPLFRYDRYRRLAGLFFTIISAKCPCTLHLASSGHFLIVNRDNGFGRDKAVTLGSGTLR
jgi:hypothetical protein